MLVMELFLALLVFSVVLVFSLALMGATISGDRT
jgi:hypothetical protein